MNATVFITMKRLVNRIRAIYPEMPIQTLPVFLEVTQRPAGITPSEVADIVDMTRASAGRHCNLLTKTAMNNRQGLDLCEWRENKEDSRSKLLVLNKKGKLLAKELEDILLELKK